MRSRKAASVLWVVLFLAPLLTSAQEITVAAASDLQFALREIGSQDPVA
jgi:hypothetical protein